MVLPVFGHIGREVITGVQLIISEKLIDSAMESVGSRLDHHVNVRPGGSAELGTGVSLDFKFLNCVYRRMDSGRFEKRAVVVHAVERVITVIAAVSRHGERLAL